MKEILLAPLFFLLREKVSPVVLWNFRSSHRDGVASVFHLPTALLQGPELLSNLPRCFLKRELSDVTADQRGTDLLGELAETLGHSLEDLQQSETDLKMCELRVNVPISDLKVSDNFDL